MGVDRGGLERGHPLVGRRGHAAALTATAIPARELYSRAGVGLDLASGFLAPGAELVVESQMDAGWLYIDGARVSHPFPFGARAEIRALREPLHLFADPRRWASAAGRQVLSALRDLDPELHPRLSATSWRSFPWS